MSLITEILGVWMLAIGGIFVAALGRGAIQARARASQRGDGEAPAIASPCEVLVPITGRFAGQEEIVRTLLAQDHPNYRVAFIVEGESDPANPMVDRLCLSHGNARKILSGVSLSCGQKNHNLITGIRNLRPETQVVVFCDATNRVDPGWLLRFTRPLDSDSNRVLTTFRDFDPIPPTLGGVCQAIYAAFLLVLPRLRPSPWGGATAMHRRLLERLRVTDAWSRTVVDDVVLGRLLYERRVPLILDRGNRLETPLRNRSMRDFLAYLERQVLFPKFADPFIWLATLALHLNLTLATLWAFLSCLALFPLHLVGAWAGWTAWGFLLCEAVTALVLRGATSHRIPAWKWLIALYPCIILGAYVFLRSMFLREILWQGRRYLVGRDGMVLSITREDGS
ncbi:MAG: glycosyltransferase family 2 protein [Thermodesulfobacteriota bacterium]